MAQVESSLLTFGEEVSSIEVIESFLLLRAKRRGHTVVHIITRLLHDVYSAVCSDLVKLKGNPLGKSHVVRR